ncbi:MAG: hypothetical protein GYB31_08560 [Bacteroidetes bacterium]|nr:hypothetical protein [Bacteroidota bacterium]
MNLEQNKKNAIAFYKTAYEGNPQKTVDLYVGKEYIQHQIWPGNDEYITMDFFRFDTNGKICEHWDAIQQIPDESANPNTMY